MTNAEESGPSGMSAQAPLQEPGQGRLNTPLATTRKLFLPVLAVLVVGGIWQLLVVQLNVAEYILPPPSKFLSTLGSSWGILWSEMVVTLQEVLYGFVIATVVSIPLGFLLATVYSVRETFYPLVIFFQVIPKIAVAPLFVVWFGVGKFSVTILTFTLCFFPIVVNSMTGFMELEPRLLYLTRSMGATRWQTFRYVRMQAALPFIFSGLKVAIVFATTGAIVGEFVGSNAGLGYLLDRATGFLDTRLVFADLVVLSAMGIALSYVIEAVQWALMPWRRGRRTR